MAKKCHYFVDYGWTGGSQTGHRSLAAARKQAKREREAGQRGVKIRKVCGTSESFVPVSRPKRKKTSLGCGCSG